jgi:methylated-DNA-[protein]-cysteine S-methyltransferase
MTPKHPSCRAIESDLVATATGEAGAAATRRVEDHTRGCAPCRAELGRYRAIDSIARNLRHDAPPASDIAASHSALQARLADLKSRVLTYGIVPSPLGNILVARSEHGVSLVEYLGEATTLAGSRLHALADVETVESSAEIARLRDELLDFLAGRRRELGWRLDLRLAGSDFRRSVLEAASDVPYGAVTSYASIARRVGKPGAERAVAQALRWNPLPIVVPCHRIVGSSGKLTGYAGDKLGLKRRLLDVEGVRTEPASRDFRVAREGMYVRAGEDRAYCLPTCGDLPSHSLANLTLIASRASIDALGLEPCSDCRPDLHPLAS